MVSIRTQSLSLIQQGEKKERPNGGRGGLLGRTDIVAGIPATDGWHPMADYGPNELVSNFIDLNIRPKSPKHPFKDVTPQAFKAALRGETKTRLQQDYFPYYSAATVGRWLNHPKDKPMSQELCATLVDALAQMWNLKDTGDAQRDSSGAGISVTRKRVILTLLGDYSHNEKVSDYTARKQSLTASRQVLAALASAIELDALDLHAIAKAVCDAIAAAYDGTQICESARKLRTMLDLTEMGVCTAHEMAMATRTLLDYLTVDGLISENDAGVLMEAFPREN